MLNAFVYHLPSVRFLLRTLFASWSYGPRLWPDRHRLDEGSMTSIALYLRVWFRLRPVRSPGIRAGRLGKGWHSSHCTLWSYDQHCLATHETRFMCDPHFQTFTIKGPCVKFWLAEGKTNTAYDCEYYTKKKIIIKIYLTLKMEPWICWPHSLKNPPKNPVLSMISIYIQGWGPVLDIYVATTLRST